MEQNQEKFYRIKWLYAIIRYGLFWHGVRNRMARIGIDLMPYYWVMEGSKKMSPPEIRDENADAYSLTFLEEQDIVKIKKSIQGIEHQDLLGYFKEGQLCVGLKLQDTITAYMFAKTGNLTFRGRRFEFDTNEAYLHGMYTFEAFRGKNIAPHLRYQSYEMLRSKGLDTFYSASEYFNKSTIRFKSKLNAVHIKLYLSVRLFKKFNWNYTLKKYEQEI